MLVARKTEDTVGDEEHVKDSQLEAGFDIGRLAEAPGDVGNSFSADSFVAERGDQVECALWGAVHLLDERAAMNTRLAQRVAAQGLAKSLARFESAARRASADAGAIRRMLQTPPSCDELDEGEAA